MVISGSEHSSKVALEFFRCWWRALVIAFMISLSTEEILLFHERIQVVTVTDSPNVSVIFVFCCPRISIYKVVQI